MWGFRSVVSGKGHGNAKVGEECEKYTLGIVVHLHFHFSRALKCGQKFAKWMQIEGANIRKVAKIKGRRNVLYEGTPTDAESKTARSFIYPR